MPSPTPHDVRFFAGPAELRDWLEANHATADELWVGYHPRSSGLPSLSWEQLVDEVLCFGWIDGVRMRLEVGSAQRITPRRDGSTWSARNVGRVGALRAEGRMRPAGEAAFARRRADRTAVYSFESAAALGDDEEAVLRARPAAWAFWEAQPKGYRRVSAHWVMSAKRPETRERRLAMLADACAAGERLGVLTSPARRRPEDAA
jgi:uncharacterized protein YdeI (YjbR/CyaY-like superfamily)